MRKRYFLLLYVAFAAWMLSCARQIPSQAVIEQVVKDTFSYEVLPVAMVEGVAPRLGESIKIPSLQMEIVRLNQDSVLVKRPVRKQTRVERRTSFVPTQYKDKSKNYQNSHNRSKVKDKSNSGISGNRLNLGAWWLWLLLLAVLAVYLGRSYLMKYFRL
jgi:hypothetical protein